MTTQKPWIAPMKYFSLAFWALATCLAFYFVSLSTPESDTTLSAGKQVSTARLLEAGAILFGGYAIIMVGTGVIGVVALNEPRRRYIASLPRSQQWKIWPFHGIKPSVDSSQPPTA